MKAEVLAQCHAGLFKVFAMCVQTKVGGDRGGCEEVSCMM